MRVPSLALIVPALLLLGAAQAAASPRLGAANVRPDTSACVGFRGNPLRTGTPVLLFLFSPPRVVDGWIRGRSSTACNQTLEGDALSYIVALRYPVSQDQEIGIALYDPSARAEYSNGEFIVRTEGAQAPLQLRQCASHEGLHLTAWRGNRRTWHAYWYLGFDVEPTCQDAEARE
jgi:hypothetical protein